MDATQLAQLAHLRIETLERKQEILRTDHGALAAGVEARLAAIEARLPPNLTRMEQPRDARATPEDVARTWRENSNTGELARKMGASFGDAAALCGPGEVAYAPRTDQSQGSKEWGPWVQWDGERECPLEDGTQVEIIWRSTTFGYYADRNIVALGFYPRSWRWAHNAGVDHILAYRTTRDA